MSDQETEWKIEEKSTGKSIDSDGFKLPTSEEAWPVENATSEEILDISQEERNDDFNNKPKVSGVMTVTLFEDETIKVEFPELGRWTLGRLEKAMSPILRQVIIERARAYRESEGLPSEFVGIEGVESEQH